MDVIEKRLSAYSNESTSRSSKEHKQLQQGLLPINKEIKKLSSPLRKINLDNINAL